jgi:hypothetical protein
MAKQHPTRRAGPPAAPGPLGTGRSRAPEAASAPDRWPFAAALLVAATCVLVSASFRLYDTDAWQHLAVGRAIWSLHEVPTTEVWTWGNAGAPNVNPSWGFSALVWPFWRAGGVAGLWAFRWLAMLGAFAIAFVSARRLGARGLAPLAAIVWCALVYRQRAQIRPEMLAGVLLALTQLILARREIGARQVAWLGLCSEDCGWRGRCSDRSA